MRKQIPALIIFLLALLSIALSSAGCGGGGGGGGSNGSSGGSFSLSPATATVGANGTVYLYASANGTPVDVSWTTTAGVLTPTGIGTATLAAPSTGTATVTATLISNPARSDTTVVTVNDTLATVRGRVVTDSNAGFGGIIIDFKAGNTTVASVITMPNGQFSAGVPTTATRFHIRNSSIPSSYYKQYSYNSLRYTTLVSTCTAPLPALSVGGDVALLTNIVINSNVGPPPPPPSGCQ
jgi:hypothetical protein